MKKGFNLAELLITIAIIGVVSAMTLPSLIAKYQEKALIHQLEAAYNIISNATSNLLNDEATTVKEFASDPNDRFLIYQDKIKKYLKIVKVCDANSNLSKTCTPRKSITKYYKDTESFQTDVYDTIANYKTFILSNGMKIFFKRDGGKCSLKRNFTYDNPDDENAVGGGTYGYACNSFYIDVNGNKGPNTVSKDIFLFWLVQDGIIPAGMQQENIWCQKFSSNGKYNYDNVTAWVLFNKNMDYLKCQGLSWNGKKTCK